MQCTIALPILVHLVYLVHLVHLVYLVYLMYLFDLYLWLTQLWCQGDMWDGNRECKVIQQGLVGRHHFDRIGSKQEIRMCLCLLAVTYLLFSWVWG